MKNHPLIRYFIMLSGFLAAASPLSAAPPVVKTVPWVGSQPLIPHDTWSGKVITLKGTSDVQGPTIEFTWDFGDASAPLVGNVGNMHVIEAKHAYTAPTGTIFIATLTVRDTVSGDASAKQYYVKVEDKSLPVEVNVAIDEALWYLWKSPNRLAGGQYQWNNVRYGNHYGNTTASAVQAFQVHGHREGQTDNPYSEAIRGGIDYLMTELDVQAMSLQGGENPESSTPPNGIGLTWPTRLGGHPIYETGAIIDALVSTGTPDATARTGNASVIGRTYKAIVQDMVDMYAWGQVDSGSARGGWQYSWNSGSDNSAAQWGAIGMIAAEKFGCTVPAWVKSRNREWLNYSYNPGINNTGGWFGYTNWNANREFSTGPCGMVQLSFTGMDSTVSPGNEQWVNCINYLRRNWASFIHNGRDTKYYSYYAFTKAMRTALPGPVVKLPDLGASLPELDWYGDNTQGLARILVDRQTSDGYWPYDGWPYVGEQTSAAWNAIILSPTLFEAGSPVAVAKAIPNPAVAGQTIQLDGSASFHQDASKQIDSWQWDLDNNGTFEVSGPFPTVSFPALGDYPVKLRVTDDAAQEAAAETILTIRVTTPPLAPTAVAGGPYSFCPATKPWFLNGTGSINPDEGLSEPTLPGDTIVSYAWDLDGDGQFDDATGAQPDITAFFDGIGPGSYLIQLKVTDRTATSFPSSQRGDLSDTDSAIVVVRLAADDDCNCVKDLVARAKPGKVQLVWTNYTGAHHYNVYRSTVAGGPYVKIASPITTYSTYLDGTVVNGTTYYYVVRPATFLDQEICQSNQASAKPVATRR